MTRYTLNITAEDLLDLLKKQRARYSVKLDNAVIESDFQEAKILMNKLEELAVVLDTTPAPGSEVSLTIDIELAEIPVPSLSRGVF